MTGNDYQKLAMRTCNIPYDKKKDMLRHAVFGLASEAGEVAGILQKEWAISKIINGKLYDTSKAQEICSVVVPVDEIPDYNFPFFCLGGQEVTIYKGRTEYFITYYCCLNQVSEEWVKKWLGEQNVDKYIELFGEPEMA